MKREAHPFAQEQSDFRAGVRRNGRHRFLFYAVMRPLVFVLANGSFLALAWVVGLLQSLEASEGVMRTVRIGVLLGTYLAYLFAFGWGWVKLEKRLLGLLKVPEDTYSGL